MVGDMQAPAQTADESPSGTPYDYSNLTVKQLKEMLKEEGVDFKSSDLKPVLIELAETSNVQPIEGGET